VSENFYLKCISENKQIVIDQCDGNETIGYAVGLFSYISSNFEDWGADEKGQSTEKTPVKVYEIKNDVFYSQIFSEPNTDVAKSCLTQHQICSFVDRHRNWLRPDGYSTFFLFMSKGNCFITGMSFGANYKLEVFLCQFKNANTLDVQRYDRIVVPRLD